MKKLLLIIAVASAGVAPGTAFCNADQNLRDGAAAVRALVGTFSGIPAYNSNRNPAQATLGQQSPNVGEPIVAKTKCAYAKGVMFDGNGKTAPVQQAGKAEPNAFLAN